MRNLSIATITYVSAFEKLAGQSSRTACGTRERMADRLVAAAFEAIEESNSVDDHAIPEDLINFTLGISQEMADIMMMAGQDGFVRGDHPEDIYAAMMAEARVYLYPQD